MCESVAIETPSQTTSTARDPAGSVARSAMASSLRVCRLPMSQTPPTQAARRVPDVEARVGRRGAAVVAVAVDDVAATAGLAQRVVGGVAGSATAADATGPVQPTSSGDSSPAGAVCGVAAAQHSVSLRGRRLGPTQRHTGGGDGLGQGARLRQARRAAGTQRAR